jgi:hypothetical protein
MNIAGRSGPRRSAEEIERLVNEYRAGELTQEAYAEQIGVKLCTLRTWIYKRKIAPARGGFAAVRLEGGAVTGRDVLTVRWPAGVELELPMSLGEAALRGLLREVLAPCLR